MSGPTWEEIQATVRGRQAANQPLVSKMVEVKNRYNGDYILPMPTDLESPALGGMMPLLITESIDFAGMQAASVMPRMDSPAISNSELSSKRARIRRKAVAADYHRSRMKLQLRRFYRHLAGYSTGCMGIVPNLTTKRAEIVTRDPLTHYPEARANEDVSQPANCAFITQRSTGWMRKNYPELAAKFPMRNAATEPELWDFVEWHDEHVCVLGILGPHEDQHGRYAHQNQGVFMGGTELRRYPNKMGLNPFISPGRITLDKMVSQLANMVGMVDMSAHLQALSVIATEKAIFPDRYVIGDSNRTPRLVSGEWKDGRTGEVNLLQDAKIVQDLRGTPDPTNQQVIDRLERNFRISSGLVPQAGGESASAMRTGRGVEQLMSQAVTPRIQEMQEIGEAHFPHLNTAIMECYKGYWPDQKFIHFSGWPGEKGEVEFTPANDFETTENVVSYAIPGADVQGLTIIAGQLLGANIISEQGFGDIHPWVSDPAEMRRQREEEALEAAMLSSLQEQAVSGAIPATYVARLLVLRRNVSDLPTAIIKLDEELKAEQAKEPAEPAEGELAAPEMMPGLAPPPPGMGPGGMGPAPAGMPPMPPPAPGGGGMPPGDEIGPPGEMKGLRRMMESLSATPPSRGRNPIEV